MDKVGIETAIVSVSSPGIWFADDRSLSIDLARGCNEYMAKLKTRHIGRFGGFACIPLPDEEAALEEIHFSLETLGLEGICLMTHYDGTYLGDESYEAVFAELDRRRAVVFVHPTDPPESALPNLDIPSAVIEVTFDTTRAVANLMHQGVLNRYPNIRYILAHGGGTIPYLAWRFAAGVKYRQKAHKPGLLRTAYDFYVKHGPESGLQDLRGLYYDTAAVSGPYALNTLHSFAGPKQIVFGSDLPFTQVIAAKIAANITRYTSFEEQDYRAINRDNCLGLFPDLATDHWKVTAINAAA